MSKQLFGLPQIAKLHEIQEARLRVEGRGIHAEVQELISRLTSGGVGTGDADDPFLVQSKVLWDKGWGRELGFTKLDAYRKSLEKDGLVTKPECPAGMPEHLNRLVLWDRRPLVVKKGQQEIVSLVKACRLSGVAYGGKDDTLIQHEGTPEITVPVRWLWCQDGRVNRDRKPSDCRQSFVPPEVGAEGLTGLLLYVQDPSVIGGEGDAWHVMDLPGSVPRVRPSLCASLRLILGRPALLLLGRLCQSAVRLCVALGVRAFSLNSSSFLALCPLCLTFDLFGREAFSCMLREREEGHVWCVTARQPRNPRMSIRQRCAWVMFPTRRCAVQARHSVPCSRGETSRNGIQPRPPGGGSGGDSGWSMPHA